MTLRNGTCVVMLSVINTPFMLSVIMLSVVILNVMAPDIHCQSSQNVIRKRKQNHQVIEKQNKQM